MMSRCAHAACLVVVSTCWAQDEAPEPRQASGGVLIPEQACYDVQSYDLTLRVDPARKHIEGSLAMFAQVVKESAALVLDLDQALRVERVAVGVNDEQDAVLACTHEDNRIRVPRALVPGQGVRVTVHYGGVPRPALNAPWNGGFTWSTTPDGKPWIATSCQGEGADLWWPCKDHPSDKPARMDLRICVPDDLVCASNGKLMAAVDDAGWRTFHWRVSVPIANYCVALNIAPYEVIETTYDSLAGDKVPVTFYVLPQSKARAEKALPEFLDHVRHMEEVCGPYPFRAEKYGIAETPHLGMEHQTIIAYGNKFRKPSYDYDWLHHHEMCHEWWANLVTCRDWKDMWIHEGIGTYMQGLYIESRRGRAQYLAQVGDWRRRLVNARPVAPREVQDSKQIYFGRGSGNDLYYKGACIVHTLRFLVGDEKFFVALRRLAYPDPALEKVTDGSCVRFEDTDGVQRILEEHTGVALGWFFDVYLRQPALPELVVERGETTATLRWKTPPDLPFPMPILVRIDGVEQRVAMPDGRAEVKVSRTQQLEIDKEGWVLRGEGKQ
jgi:aminopeptidase N